ncbi:hypothetical protein HYU16_03440 [Candidatus Woesearchaeota archaeon]|nr:hypothetical protein [Candidatus Woesearchaeota archaeon]
MKGKEMAQVRKLASIYLALALLVLSSIAVFAADPTKINTFLGNVTIGGSSAAGGAVIEAFIGSASSAASTFTVGQPVGGQPLSPENFTMDFECDSGSTVFLKVWGINASTQTCSNQFVNRTNLSVSLVANNGACGFANACSSGICCVGTSSVNSSGAGGTCKSTCAAAAATDTGGGGGGTGAGGGGGGGGAATAPAAPSQETVDTVKAALPPAFQEAVAAGNVEIKTVAAPEVKEVPVAADTVAKTLAQVETIVKTEEAKQALTAIQEAVSSGGASAVSVKKTVEVVKATNKVTKEEIIVSVVKLAVTAPGNQDLKNVEVVEVIPKAAASNVDQVTFKGEQPAILEADPVVKWFFSQVQKGTTKDLSYTVNKDIRSIGTSTVAVQGRAEAAPPAVEAPPAPPVEEKAEEKPPVEAKKPTPINTVLLVVVVAVVAVGAWLFLKGRKKKVMK